VCIQKCERDDHNFVSWTITSALFQMSRSPRPRAPPADPALLKAASVLIGESVDLTALPDSATKTEFLDLARLALQDKLSSLQKARLEVLSARMTEFWERHLARAEIEKHRQEAQVLREKRDKVRRMLKQKTKKGQPVLRNLAKLQLQQVRAMLEKEGQ
jgi:hypothetical protein